MSAILKFDFQKGKQLRFSEVNYLNHTQIFPETMGNKNKLCTLSTPVKEQFDKSENFNKEFYFKMF